MTQAAASATIFSLAGDPPRALVHDGDGHAEFDSAHLHDGGDRHACALHKLSAVGATLRVAEALREDSPMRLELANGQSMDGRLAWHSAGEAGFVFDQPIDVVGALARNLANLPAERRRVPRVETQQAVSLRHKGNVELARSRNISQGGAGIETRLELAIGDPVQLVFDGLRPLDGTVRWTGPRLAGVAFHEELGWQVLMPWLRQMQQNGSAGTHADAPHGEGLMPDKHAIRIDAPARVREGVRWWNARIRALTAHLVELETRAPVAAKSQLWVSLPHVGGGPASVLEVRGGRILCEFRLPLRPTDLGIITSQRRPN
ncbi:MAG: PilZ domain-containing protein [Sphingomonas sp.]|uniref:PilZ domain-containing protein n=1 Tax=Sphingomonas sp. TaxID=28214 RepID=UPI001AFF6BE6|nr:PilZ domain-containing protein [Sphingomonas sp.]MBO9622881.1 PilZ domain-containing protein [Sphingomonas sp.]